jgi:hypothetical protein
MVASALPAFYLKTSTSTAQNAAFIGLSKRQATIN